MITTFFGGIWWVVDSNNNNNRNDDNVNSVLNTITLTCTVCLHLYAPMFLHHLITILKTTRKKKKLSLEWPMSFWANENTTRNTATITRISNDNYWRVFFLLNLITDNARSFWFFILFFRVHLKSKTIAFTNQPMAMTIINLNLFTQQMPIACLFCDFSFLNINSLVCECVCMFYFLSACVSILLWISFANHITSHHFFCTRAYAQLFLA